MNKYSMILAALVVFSITSCGKKNTAQLPTQVPVVGQPAVAMPQQTNIVEDFVPDTGNYGTVTQCPVMGEKVIVGKDTKAVKYKGKVYYLCCPTCMGQFKQNPEKYAK